MALGRQRPPRIVLPSPGALRRERRTLLEARERLLRDLGGLIYEMFRHDRFNEGLVRERCAELLDLDERLEQVEELLDVATHRTPLARCSCGAELPPFARFCSSCGLAVGGTGDGEQP
jgi:hypothetical protein